MTKRFLHTKTNMAEVERPRSRSLSPERLVDSGEIIVSTEDLSIQARDQKCTRCQLQTWRSWFKWRPTSMLLLVQAEHSLLSHLKNHYEDSYVPISQGQKQLRSIQMNTQSTNIPIILIHGMGGGIGLWALNMDSLSQNRPLYAFDVLGFGCSSRPRFSKKADVAEREFVESVEDWRKQKGLERMIVLGHSLGGYIASAYTLRYPHQVEHLILADPWGFNEMPRETDENGSGVPVWVKVIATLMQPFNPLSGLRAAGPLGPSLVQRFRPDLQEKFSCLGDDTSVFDYIYHCNAQKPSGEAAYKSLSFSLGWAKNPMLHRIKDLSREVPITFVYGSRSWMDSECGYQTKDLRKGSYVDVQIIKGAGHHVYADKPIEFNKIVNQVGEKVDSNIKKRKEVNNGIVTSVQLETGV